MHLEANSNIHLEVLITKKEILYGLLANPAYHSLSPIIQNTAFKKAQINAHYLSFEIDPKDLEKSIKGLVALKAGGFNLSTPFKDKIIPYLDQIDPIAKQLESVNTVKIEGSNLKGYSTDGDGFWQSADLLPRETTVILGTGGAARAIMANAFKYGVKELAVFNRQSPMWQEKSEIVSNLSQTKLHDLSDREELTYYLKKADLIINATTVGMNSNNYSLLAKYEIALIKKTAVVYDIIYEQKSPLLQKSASIGLKTIDGIPMLIHQGALSFKIWTGVDADIEEMTSAIKKLIL